jgi:IS6 family transposase
MNQPNPFKWRHYESEIFVFCVRWYLRHSLSYRNLEEMMQERGLSVDHTTIYLWVQYFASELEKRCKPHLQAINDSWRVDETYSKSRKTWMYLYRAVDSDGNTLEFLLSPRATPRRTNASSSKRSTRLLVPFLLLLRLR